MALPYPEGEVYFKRDALKLPQSPYNFDAADDKAFYNHVLVEHVWNTWATSNNTNPSLSNIGKHPRSTHLTGYASSYGTHFGVWDSTHVMFGDQLAGKEIQRDVILENNQNYNELRNLDAGGPLKTILRPVPLGKEKYMYLDLVTPCRAVYFPLAHKSGAVNEDLCTYLMVDFRLRNGVSIRSPGGNKFQPVEFHNSRGLDYRHWDTLCFDIPGIYAFLILPRQLRNMEMGLYKPLKVGDELITLWDCHECKGEPQRVTRPLVRSIDLMAVMSDNFGVDITWSPYEYSSWVLDFIKHVTELGLGLIPGVGPLLAVSFTVGLQAITDPDSFQAENILNLSADVMAAIVGSSNPVKKNLPKGWQKVKTHVVTKA